jgi:hypothetical protein
MLIILNIIKSILGHTVFKLRITFNVLLNRYKYHDIWSAFTTKVDLIIDISKNRFIFLINFLLRFR